nr:hypothetical protein [candidate division Zixibacteria bacterium]
MADNIVLLMPIVKKSNRPGLGETPALSPPGEVTRPLMVKLVTQGGLLIHEILYLRTAESSTLNPAAF